MIRLLSLAPVLLSACSGTPELKTYSLVPTAPAATPAGLADGPSGAALTAAIRVQIPSYLAPTGIAVASGPHELHYAAYHRWSEPLQEACERALRRALLGAGLSPAVQSLSVRVDQFHGSMAGDVILDATWALEVLGADPVTERFRGAEPQEASSFGSLAAAHFSLLSQLADSIASGAVPRRP